MTQAEFRELVRLTASARIGATVAGGLLTLAVGSRIALLVVAALTMAGAALAQFMPGAVLVWSLAAAAYAPSLYLLAEVSGPRRLYAVPLCIVGVSFAQPPVLDVLRMLYRVTALAQPAFLVIAAAGIALSAWKVGGNHTIEDPNPRPALKIALVVVALIHLGGMLVQGLQRPDLLASRIHPWREYVPIAAQGLAALAFFGASRTMPSPRWFALAAGLIAAAGVGAQFTSSGSVHRLGALAFDVAHTVVRPLGFGIVVSLFADRRVAIALVAWSLALTAGSALTIELFLAP